MTFKSCPDQLLLVRFFWQTHYLERSELYKIHNFNDASANEKEWEREKQKASKT
jgi:hypothetical protein